MLQLTFVNRNKPPVWLVKPRYRLGSGSDCEPRIDHPGVANLHAELVVEHESVFLEPVAGADLRLNGARITGRAALGHDAVVQIADLQLRIVDPKRASAPSQQANGWILRSKSLALAAKRYEIDRPRTFGRSKSCDICLPVAHLSREHARLSPVSGGVEVEDLRSSNGTFINGLRITKAVARLGDEISFDSVKFEVSRADQKQEVDLEATSLRPAISEQQMDVLRQEMENAKVVRPKKSAPVHASVVSSPAGARVSKVSEQRSALPLVVGLSVVLLATVAFLMYLMA